MDLNKLSSNISDATGGNTTLPPVDSWNPPFCGDMNIEIQRDGRWFYENSPIGRMPLVRLFASILKKEDDNYFLVTPVEKVGIRVADVPFVITQWCFHKDYLCLETQTGDKVRLDAPDKLELRQDTTCEDKSCIPYVRVRRNLWARLHQNVFYQLVEEASVLPAENGLEQAVVQSGELTLCLGKW